MEGWVCSFPPLPSSSLSLSSSSSRQSGSSVSIRSSSAHRNTERRAFVSTCFGGRVLLPQSVSTCRPSVPVKSTVTPNTPTPCPSTSKTTPNPRSSTDLNSSLRTCCCPTHTACTHSSGRERLPPKTHPSR